MSFYGSLRWRLDADIPHGEDFRIDKHLQRTCVLNRWHRSEVAGRIVHCSVAPGE